MIVGAFTDKSTETRASGNQLGVSKIAENLVQRIARNAQMARQFFFRRDVITRWPGAALNLRTDGALDLLVSWPIAFEHQIE